MRTKQQRILCCALVGIAALRTAAATEVAICTDLGRIVVELSEEASPLHSENFLRNVAGGHYTGTVFHRVIDDFMVQGGGFNRRLEPRMDVQTVQNESRNGLSNLRGTVAAARTADPHSAAAQFFINTVDNRRLDAGRSDWGYTVFATVTEGMDVVDRISGLPTGASGPFPDDVPNPLVAIHGAAVLDRAALEGAAGPQVQTDLLARIDAADDSEASEEALQLISHYRATCAPAEPDLLIIEAQNALAANIESRARYALEEFFATAPENHRDYSEAEILYSELAGSILAAAATSLCTEPAIPVIPDGETESLEGMLAGQTAVQTFMTASTDYLECIDDVIENDETPPEVRDAVVNSYNRFVDLTQQVGDDFNAEVRAYRARE